MNYYNIDSNINKEVIKLVRRNIDIKGEFPKFGSPETECDKCMFYGVACFPSPEYVGCYGGWKWEKEEN